MYLSLPVRVSDSVMETCTEQRGKSAARVVQQPGFVSRTSRHFFRGIPRWGARRYGGVPVPSGPQPRISRQPLDFI